LFSRVSSSQRQALLDILISSCLRESTFHSMGFLIYTHWPIFIPL
jgi:hypothetical protein